MTDEAASAPPPPATIDQIIAAACEVTDPGVFEWAAAGAGRGVTVARNTEALARLALVPLVGRDVGRVDTSTQFAGVPLEFPVVLAPVGALDLYHPEGALAAARAANETGTALVCSMLVDSPWEDVAATAPGRHLFQLFAHGDRSWLRDVLERAEGAGFGGTCVTMDSPVIGRRDSSLESGFSWTTPPEGRFNLRQHGSDLSHRSRFTWRELEFLVGHATRPVTVKGVMTAEDAVTAVDCGAAAVYVSNHGGRVVDYGISPVEVLAEIVAAVGDRVEVAVDSGFTRGAEVCAALALGATAVGIGRLQCWGLAAGGSAGLRRVLEILQEEMALTMANLGCTSVGEITAERVRWAHAPG